MSLAAVQLFRIKQLQRLQREAAPRRSIHWFPAVTQVNDPAEPSRTQQDPAEPTRIQQNPAELIRTDHSVALLRFR